MGFYDLDVQASAAVRQACVEFSAYRNSELERSPEERKTVADSCWAFGLRLLSELVVGKAGSAAGSTARCRFVS